MIRSVLGAKRRWFFILLKVIAIVKLVVVEAVGKWKSLLRFPRAPFARLFHSFWPADAFTFPPSLLSFYAWSPHASRCDARCAPAGRGFRRPVWDLRSVHASETPATAKSGSSSVSGSDPRRSPRSLFSPLLTSGP